MFGLYYTQRWKDERPTQHVNSNMTRSTQKNCSIFSPVICGIEGGFIMRLIAGGTIYRWMASEAINPASVGRKSLLDIYTEAVWDLRHAYVVTEGTWGGGGGNILKLLGEFFI